MQNEFRGKTILVTGGTGSIGSALVEELLKYEPKQVRVLSRDESKQHELLERTGYPKKLRMLIGDIRDRDRLEHAFKDVDIVYHTAALKHVPFCEYNPSEAIKTNVFGSQNVIDAALANRVKKVIGISTDKVVNPTGVYGTSKLMMEKLFTNANYTKGTQDIVFSCVRFGNVAWARGSVLPAWKLQIEREGKIRITDPEMTRFIMSVEDAANLVLEASRLTRGSEIFIFKMPSITMSDLAKIFLEKYYPGKKIERVAIGNRGKEKQHEELLGSDNLGRVFENEKMLIVIPEVKIYGLAEKQIGDYPGFREVIEHEPYVSTTHLDPGGIIKII